jgi:hypothetical protein
VGILDWLRRRICSSDSGQGNYTVSFSKDEARRIKDVDHKLRQWLEQARAGTIGLPAEPGLKEDIMDIVNVANQLYDWYVPPFRVAVEELSPLLVHDLINDLKSKGGMLSWLRLDGTYYSTDMNTFKKIVEWDWTDTRKYIADVFDCDKFAMYFKARMAIDFGINAVGVILDYSAGHAYNLVILRDPRGVVNYYLYEPQNDNLFTYEQRDKNMYAMQSYVLLL